MPNRVLRDWTDSETIDSLDVHGERFFTRLIMKVDDFGRYSANVKLLKSNLFPLKSDVRETDISRWIAACEKSGLIALYNVAQKEYLQVLNFKQTLRQKKEKYPPPQTCLADDKHMHSTRTAYAFLKRNESETESETNPAGAGETVGKEKIGSSKNSSHPPIKLPFGENFSDAWQQWKEYRLKEFKFRYKSEQSEQAAANELFKLSGGSHEKAFAIINQSIANGWKGFFELKNNFNGNKNQRPAAEIGRHSEHTPL